MAQNVYKMAFSLTCILAFAVVINAPALALPNDIGTSKTGFRKRTSSMLSRCAAVQNEEENTAVHLTNALLPWESHKAFTYSFSLNLY